MQLSYQQLLERQRQLEEERQRLLANYQSRQSQAVSPQPTRSQLQSSYAQLLEKSNQLKEQRQQLLDRNSKNQYTKQQLKSQPVASTRTGQTLSSTLQQSQLARMINQNAQGYGRVQANNANQLVASSPTGQSLTYQQTQSPYRQQMAGGQQNFQSPAVQQRVADKMAREQFYDRLSHTQRSDDLINSFKQVRDKFQNGEKLTKEENILLGYASEIQDLALLQKRIASGKATAVDTLLDKYLMTNGNEAPIVGGLYDSADNAKLATIQNKINAGEALTLDEQFALATKELKEIYNQNVRRSSGYNIASGVASTALTGVGDVLTGGASIWSDPLTSTAADWYDRTILKNATLVKDDEGKLKLELGRDTSTTSDKIGMAAREIGNALLQGAIEKWGGDIVEGGLKSTVGKLAKTSLGNYALRTLEKQAFYKYLQRAGKALDHSIGGWAGAYKFFRDSAAYSGLLGETAEEWLQNLSEKLLLNTEDVLAGKKNLFMSGEELGQTIATIGIYSVLMGASGNIAAQLDEKTLKNEFYETLKAAQPGVSKKQTNAIFDRTMATVAPQIIGQDRTAAVLQEQLEKLGASKEFARRVAPGMAQIRLDEALELSQADQQRQTNSQELEQKRPIAELQVTGETGEIQPTKRETTQIPQNDKNRRQLNKELVERVNNTNSNLYDAGSAIERDYTSQIEKLDLFDLSAEQKEEARQKLYDLANAELDARKNVVGIDVAGPARGVAGSAKKLDKANQIKSERNVYFESLQEQSRRNIIKKQKQDRQNKFDQAIEKAEKSNELEFELDGKTYSRMTVKSKSWSEGSVAERRAKNKFASAQSKLPLVNRKSWSSLTVEEKKRYYSKKDLESLDKKRTEKDESRMEKQKDTSQEKQEIKPKETESQAAQKASTDEGISQALKDLPQSTKKVYQNTLEQLEKVSSQSKSKNKDQNLVNKTNAVMLARESLTLANAYNRNPKIAKEVFGKSKVTAEDVSNRFFSVSYAEKSASKNAQNQVFNQEVKSQAQEIREKYEGTDQWLKAPNGNDTNLTKDQWCAVRTNAFKKWFGDWENDPKNASKVLDENGEPKVVYHITNESFNTFDITKARQSADIPAFFFSSGTQDWQDMGDNTIAAFLNIKNPTEKPIVRGEGMKYKEELEKQGYDGTILEDDEVEETEYAAFYPNQIKSVDNKGTFSSDDDNIYNQTAYHGTPHIDFEAFSLKAIGSGEGAQAHGHGLYFALDRGTAEFYRGVLTHRDAPYYLNGEKLTDIYDRALTEEGDANHAYAAAMQELLFNPENNRSIRKTQERFATQAVQDREKQIAYDELMDKIDRGEIATIQQVRKDYYNRIPIIYDQAKINAYDFETFKKNLKTVGKQMYDTYSQSIAEADKQVRFLYRVEDRATSPGAVFDVEVPEIDQMLHEGESWDNQPQDVKTAIEKLIKDKKIEFEKPLNSFNGKRLYNKLAADLGSQRAASKALNKYGVMGIFYTGKQDGDCVVVFNDKDVQVLQKELGKINQAIYDQIHGQDIRGQAIIKQNQAMIKLLDGADASTLMHESSHIYLQQLHTLAMFEGVDKQTQKDWQTVSKWLDYKPTQVELTTEQQEKFARGFEAYLRNGQAPASGLKGVFQRFRQWLGNIYKTYKQLGGRPPKAVRQVMDRMVATDFELTQAKKEAKDLKKNERYTSEYWLDQINKRLPQYSKEARQELADTLVYMQETMGQGAQSSLVYDQSSNGVLARITSSNNAPWYQEWYANAGRKPNIGEMIEIAQGMLLKGDYGVALTKEGQAQVQKFVKHGGEIQFDGNGNAIYIPRDRIENVIEDPKEIQEYLDALVYQGENVATNTKTVKVQKDQTPVKSNSGKIKVSRLEARMKGVADQIHNATKLDIEGLNLQTFEEATNKDQLEKAARYVANNPDATLAILKGEKRVPEGLLRNSLLVAYSQYAELEAKAGEIQEVIKVASLQATRIGQELQMLSNLNPNSVTSVMSRIYNIKTEAIANMGKDKYDNMVKKEKAKIEREAKRAIKIQQQAETKSTWQNFIESIKC